MNLATPFIRITENDLYPDFDIDHSPDPGSYWDPEEMGPSEQWNQLYRTWEKARIYHMLHSPRFIPIANAYEIPGQAKSWADAIIAGEKARPLAMYGPVGTGKTHGACAVACYLSALWERQNYTSAPDVFFTQASRLLSQLKDFGTGDQRENLYRCATRSKVLIVDDLTRFKVTDFDMESIGQVLDDRAGASLPTIITLNDCGPADLVNLVPQFLASRLQAGTSLNILGADRRVTQT